MKEGDANSRYFNACVKAGGSRNRITTLRVGGGWVEDVAGIRGAVSSFFSNHFSDVAWDLPLLDDITFPTLTLKQVAFRVVFLWRRSSRWC